MAERTFHVHLRIDDPRLLKLGPIPLSHKDIDRYQRSLNLLKEVVAQLNKDFRLNAFEVGFSGNGETAYQELTDQLIPVIEYLLEKQPDRFWNLLYSIDLNEDKVKETLFGTGTDTLQQLTDLILKRELQKVVIRRYYAGKSLP